MADVGYRNTVFGAEAQAANKHINAWLDAGIRHYRLEFVHESSEDIAQIDQAFQQTLNGALPTSDLARRLRHFAPQGVTEGSLFVSS